MLCKNYFIRISLPIFSIFLAHCVERALQKLNSKRPKCRGELYNFERKHFPNLKPHPIVMCSTLWIQKAFWFEANTKKRDFKIENPIRYVLRMGLLKHVQNRSVLHKYICMTAGGQKITTYIFTYPKSDKKKCKMVIINVFFY